MYYATIIFTKNPISRGEITLLHANMQLSNHHSTSPTYAAFKVPPSHILGQWTVSPTSVLYPR